MSCTRLTLKKYTKRPSPPYHAGECKGTTIKGNDSHMYKSVADIRGVYTWKRIEKSISLTRKRGTKLYQIHDNGGRPFVVDVSSAKKTVEIYKQTYDRDSDKYTIEKRIGSYKYKQIWLGRDLYAYGMESERFPGHTVLLELANGKFLFVGWKIFEFQLKPGDVFVKYISYVGNNDVPYSWVQGKTHTYLLTEEVVIPSDLLNLKDDVYNQYYRMTKAPKGSVKKHAMKLTVNIIEGRSTG